MAKENGMVQVSQAEYDKLLKASQALEKKQQIKFKVSETTGALSVYGLAWAAGVTPIF
jgi:hypothetical protein